MNATNHEIRAIETAYNGYRFRSRLEARWAVFFDALGVKYEYEAEGYETDAGWYLPDFWIPQWNSFIEVKGSDPTDAEWAKIHGLQTGKPENHVYAFIGQPFPGEFFFKYGDFPEYDPNPYEAEFVLCNFNAGNGRMGLGLMFTEWGFDFLILDKPSENWPEFKAWDCLRTSGDIGIDRATSLMPSFYRADKFTGKRLYDAFNKARQARFEHGETPK